MKLHYYYGIWLFVLLTAPYYTFSASMSPKLQEKISEYQGRLTQWASNPVVIEAVKKSNQSVSKFDNQMWKSLTQTQPQVSVYINSPAGQLLSSWQNMGGIGKLFVRNLRGELVAGSKMPAIYNISDRPPFTNAVKGSVWHAKKVKPDPTTKQASVQISAPVKEAGKVIGIIHANVIVE